MVLAPLAGFFFGGTEYDEYYYGDLEYTIKTIDRLEAVVACSTTPGPISNTRHPGRKEK